VSNDGDAIEGQSPRKGNQHEHKILTAAVACCASAMIGAPAVAQEADEPDWGYYAGRVCDATESWPDYDHEGGTLAYWEVQGSKNRGECVRAHVQAFKNGVHPIPDWAR
jgi:hypothetical protein